MRVLTHCEVAAVSGASDTAISGEDLNQLGINIFDGAVVGATTLAFSFGKWAGVAGFITFGLSQLVGVAVGLVAGGVVGAVYGASHSSADTEAYFMDIVKTLG